MGKVRYTTGNYAQTSYMVPQINVPVYCVEELCYILQENAILLDREICDKELARWLDEECGLSQLSSQLMTLLRQDGSPGAVVGIILDYVGYGTPEIRNSIEQLYRQSTDTDIHVKKKKHADYLAGNKKYAQALKEYVQLLREIPEQNHMLMSQTMTNLGTVLCRLYHFQDASKLFLGAYKEYPLNEEAAISYLATIRLQCPEDAYVSFIAENPQWHDFSMQLEKRYGAIQSDYLRCGNCLGLKKLFDKKDSTDVSEYYQEISVKLAEMKQEYRDMVAE